MNFSSKVLFTLLSALALDCALAFSQATVTVRNPINVARPSETISLHAADLKQTLSVDDIRRVHVRDEKSGKDLLTQAVDDDGDGKYDELLFQTDLAPNETRKFDITIGQRRIPTPQDFKAYGRFVREREDDFAWENDRIAHRMYGKALETWPQEPLTSSAVDVWVKRVHRLVINDWYMVDDYHRDHGEGGDFYSAGSTRGCGGNGIWADDHLYPSANFVDSRVLANGPIRVLFELTYPAWDAAGTRIREVKRISLDAGQNMDRFESHYATESGNPPSLDAIGIRKGKNPELAKSQEQGTLRTWETLPDTHGHLGCAVIVDPATLAGFTEDAGNFLAPVKIPADHVVTYYAGFGWSEAGFPSAADWDRYVANFAARVKAPVEVTISAH
ncbi:MAG TPA: DUF4861 family protein [Terriglobales bacterium]